MDRSQALRREALRREATAASDMRGWHNVYSDGVGGPYQVVPVTLPVDLVEHLVSRVGVQGLSAYITQALMRQEPMASLIDFHHMTAVALGLLPEAMESSRPALYGRESVR